MEEAKEKGENVRRREKVNIIENRGERERVGKKLMTITKLMRKRKKGQKDEKDEGGNII